MDHNIKKMNALDTNTIKHSSHIEHWYEHILYTSYKQNVPD